MTFQCRRASRDDAAAIARIYNQSVVGRSASFETAPRSAADIASWFDSGLPIVAAVESSALIAFAACFPWRAHSRYRGIAELSVYVDGGHRGRGAGRSLLEALLPEAEEAGLWKLLAGVFPDNEASLALFRSSGFREVGRYEKQAQLEGRWRDVVVLEKLIPTNQLPRVIFACVHNAGRSQMAAAIFNAGATHAKAISAGTHPAERVHPEVVVAMAELGIDLSTARPRKLTSELAQGASLLITMGCGDACPVVPGLRRDDWPLEDPSGKPLDRVREIRDQIRARVESLIQAGDWG